jgi:cytochrome c oxidase subunit II
MIEAEARLRRDGNAGSAAIACTLALLLVAFTFITVYLFAAKVWWFPPPITAFGHQIDAQFDLTLLICGVIFVLAQLGLAWAVYRSRDHGQKVRYFESSLKMEVVWTLATLVLFVGLGIYGEHAWAEAHFQGAGPGAMRVEVTGMQFAWYFRYPGPDGKFGRIRPDQVSASNGNPLGLDPNDPAGKDDIVSPVMYVPVGRPVDLLIRSQDVDHGFFVRELRLKQDAVPGMVIPMHFLATQTGQYDITCTQLCGLGHYRMHTFLNVVSEGDFVKWLREQEAALQQ